MSRTTEMAPTLEPQKCIKPSPRRSRAMLHQQPCLAAGGHPTLAGEVSSASTQLAVLRDRATKGPHYPAAPSQVKARSPSAEALDRDQVPAGSPGTGAEQHAPRRSDPAPSPEPGWCQEREGGTKGEPETGNPV